MRRLPAAIMVFARNREAVQAFGNYLFGYNASTFNQLFSDICTKVAAGKTIESRKTVFLFLQRQQQRVLRHRMQIAPGAVERMIVLKGGHSEQREYRLRAASRDSRSLLADPAELPPSLLRKLPGRLEFRPSGIHRMIERLRRLPPAPLLFLQASQQRL